MEKRIAIFASGNGSNAANLIRYFKYKDVGTIGRVFCNNPKAGVLEHAEEANITTILFSKTELEENQRIEKELKNYKPDLIILAGFLLKIPAWMVQDYPSKIINLHPSLLPKYGGKGMYGIRVHQAVIENNELESGITIHFVNEEYDKGAFIFQKSIPIELKDTAETLATKISKIEHQYLPSVVDALLNNSSLPQ